MKYITPAYELIMASEVFRTDGPSIDLPHALIDLADAVKDENEDIDWSLGEFTEAPLDSLLVGAYWSLSEWHSGQSSDTYRALCAIGQVFKPGCTSAPEEGDNDYDAYDLIGKWFESHPAS